MSEGASDSVNSEQQSLPGIDFATFVLSLSHSALVHLGDAPDPSGGEAVLSSQMASQTIDLLHLLQQKTVGNLTGKEERLLDQVLFDLRARLTELAKSGS